MNSLANGIVSHGCDVLQSEGIERKIKGFSTKETSEILGWTESKVKSTLFRSIKKLEQELNKEGDVYEQKLS